MSLKELSLDKLLQECGNHIGNLIAERGARQGGMHADDYRIATEIAERQFYLGRMRNELRDQIKRCRKQIEDNEASIVDINECYRSLQLELNIANKDL